MLRRLLRGQLRRRGVRIPDWFLDSDAQAMRRMAKLLQPDDVVLDLGAHVGNAAIEFSYCAAKVFSFEPNPEVFEELKAQTAPYPNITIFNKAISDTTGTTTLYFEKARRGRFYEGSTIVAGKSNVSYGKSYEVETISFTDVLNMIGTDVSIIKMDIEGAEYQVLDAMLASGKMEPVKKIYVECHVDRVEGLAEAKKKTLAAAEASGQLDKIDFTWP